jgi:hypothetical protein
MFRFEYNGGISNPSRTTNLKFLVFAVFEGDEVSKGDALGRGIFVKRTNEGYQAYQSKSPIVKIFSYEAMLNLSPSFRSFYFKLEGEDAKSEVTIVPLIPQGPTANWYFKGCGRFLTTREVLAILDPATRSASFLRRQGPPSRDLVRRMITVRDLEKEREERARVERTLMGRMIRTRED